MLVDLVQATTRDGVRLDGMLQLPTKPAAWPVDGLCFLHGTGSNFYGSTLFDALGAVCLDRGCAVLRVNTRGHDGISNAATARGGRRLGAAYEVVDDARHDIAAWVDFLRERVGPRVGLVGHSLGAVKAIYALAHEMELPVTLAVALSPPRLSYSWFCQTDEGPRFLETMQRAEALVQAGTPAALLEVSLPLPMIITAAGYLEKYGPEERYNYLNQLRSIRCPLFVSLGEIESAHNVAFRDAIEAIGEQKRPNIVAVKIDGADHFYTNVREALIGAIDRWLQTVPAGDLR